MYAFDQCTSGNLDLIPKTEASGTFRTHVLIQDVYSKENNGHIAWIDWIAIISSFVKILELSLLWKQNAIDLVFISSSCWGFFLISSMLLQALRLSREYSDKSKERVVDLVGGQLPTPIRVGYSHKILLGAPQNVRHTASGRSYRDVGVSCPLRLSLPPTHFSASKIPTYLGLGLDFNLHGWPCGHFSSILAKEQIESFTTPF